MFNLPFWIYFAVAVMLALLSIFIRKLRFIDIQIMILVVAISMSADMLFCKQFKMYHYVDMNLKYIGWYSFWANLVICPAIGLIFIKFVPRKLSLVALYIGLWTVFFTLFEMYIAKPFGILHYRKWHIFPYSTIGDFIALCVEYLYYRILIKRLR